MKKPLITRMQSQLRQVRTRSARHCQVRAHEQDEPRLNNNIKDGTIQEIQGSRSGREEMMD
jgi:hypothetical protein